MIFPLKNYNNKFVVIKFRKYQNSLILTILPTTISNFPSLSLRLIYFIK